MDAMIAFRRSFHANSLGSRRAMAEHRLSWISAFGAEKDSVTFDFGMLAVPLKRFSHSAGGLDRRYLTASIVGSPYNFLASQPSLRSNASRHRGCECAG